MATLVFNQFHSDLLGLLSGTYYWALVTTAPALKTLTLRSQLTEAAGGNYAPQTATGRAVGSSGNTTFLDFDNPQWTALTTNNADTVKGAVLCKQAGGSPANSDKVYFYCELSTPYTPQGADLRLNVPALGALTITSI